jgi:hypothetical protein
MKPMPRALYRRAICVTMGYCACISAVVVLVCGFGAPAPARVTDPKSPIRVCDQYPGEDAGEKIQLCIRDLPVSGGTADARGLSGLQRISKTLVLDKRGINLLLGPGTEFILADGAYVDITGYGAVIKGGGSTTTFRAGKNSGFRIGGQTSQTTLWVLEGFKISGSTTAPSGILMQNSTAGLLKDLWISGFASGLDIRENCWSIRSVDTYVVEDDIGYKFSGANANAWNIRGGWIINNRTGIQIDIRDGIMQGLSITDGTQMEGNRDSAILLSSGIIDGLEISDVYAETKAGQRFLTVAGNGESPVKIPLLAVRGGFIGSVSVIPFFFRLRNTDTLNALISNLLMVHGSSLMPVADVSGKVHLKIQNTISVSSSGAYTPPFEP